MTLRDLLQEVFPDHSQPPVVFSFAESITLRFRAIWFNALPLALFQHFISYLSRKTTCFLRVEAKSNLSFKPSETEESARKQICSSTNSWLTKKTSDWPVMLNYILLNSFFGQGIDGEVGEWRLSSEETKQRRKDLRFHIYRPGIESRILPTDSQWWSGSYSFSSFSSSLKYLPLRVVWRIKWDNARKVLCKQDPTVQHYFLIQLQFGLVFFFF